MNAVSRPRSRSPASSPSANVVLPRFWPVAARYTWRIDVRVSGPGRYHPGMPEPTITTVVFDLGGVLIDWDPRHLYRQLFSDPQEMEVFLRDVVSPDWNAEQDSGRTWAEATAELLAQHPDHEAMILAYSERWAEMLAGPISGTVDILREV